jgi:hypothetical protein
MVDFHFLPNFPPVRSHCCSFSFLKNSVAFYEFGYGFRFVSESGSRSRRSRIPLQVSRFSGSEIRKNLKGLEKLIFSYQNIPIASHFIVDLRKVFPSTWTSLQSSRENIQLLLKHDFGSKTLLRNFIISFSYLIPEHQIAMQAPKESKAFKNGKMVHRYSFTQVKPSPPLSPHPPLRYGAANLNCGSGSGPGSG